MGVLVVLHLLLALALIFLVLVQDSKGGGALGIGGGSNSLLGATGAQSLYSKMTRVVAVLFAVSCLSLSMMITRENRSEIESAPVVAPPSTAAPVTGVPAATEPAQPSPTPAATPEKGTQPATK